MFVNKARVALVFTDLNLPTQPYINNFFDQLEKVDSLILHKFTSRGDFGKISDNLGNVSRGLKLFRLVNFSVQYPQITIQWFYKN